MTKKPCSRNPSTKAGGQVMSWAPRPMTSNSAGSTGSPSVTYSMSMPLTWALGTDGSLQLLLSCRLPSRRVRPCALSRRRRFDQRCPGATRTLPTRAWLETHEDDLSRRHAHDENGERGHLEGPLLNREQEDGHADDGPDVGVHGFRLRVGPAL